MQTHVRPHHLVPYGADMDGRRWGGGGAPVVQQLLLHPAAPLKSPSYWRAPMLLFLYGFCVDLTMVMQNKISNHKNKKVSALCRP
ncbi:hypothetical protein EYF80_015223 [Liparis tanakae]|uniref:Uncharacterized protein n=1 Tax=Liparis tanakae TaxID=230148 RepID=A0A4Z2IBG1_9TELE|nr:hypothetical protein EYF80_015223 [Liparis tanakae]